MTQLNSTLTQWQAKMSIVVQGRCDGDYYLKDHTDAYCHYCDTRIPELDE